MNNFLRGLGKAFEGVTLGVAGAGALGILGPAATLGIAASAINRRSEKKEQDLVRRENDNTINSLLTGARQRLASENLNVPTNQIRPYYAADIRALSNDYAQTRRRSTQAFLGEIGQVTSGPLGARFIDTMGTAQSSNSTTTLLRNLLR